MKLQMLIYKSLCIAASLLMTRCPREIDYWSCDSLEIYNDTNYPVAIHMNFDPQNGSMYTFGEIRYIISAYSLLGLVEHRYLHICDDQSSLFYTIWETPDNEPIYCKLYRVNPDTYKEEELLAEWDSSQSDESSFFNEKSWKSSSYVTTANGIDYDKWTFTISENVK